ncbi:Meiotic recombination protein SPO11 [Chionoecetes opilio]|uniref:DNA topoisomerase (ATP-hydrolyzing) n=1 Tax=Chionoecetes opilio TaxID=41210 RepID=A0A8J5D1D8_CHIOP|nr:Meiotic recombination protein SPO11 [Chionoecetes opilio]
MTWRLDRGLNISRSRKKAYETVLERRNACKEKYARGEYSHMQFISAVAYTMDTHHLLLETTPSRDGEESDDADDVAVDQENQASQQHNHRLCAVCLAPRERTICFRLCNHAQVCPGCSNVMEAMGNPCPVCRVPVQEDVYYENVGLYRTQNTLDRAFEDLTRMLGVPRRALHLTTTGKGLVGAAWLTPPMTGLWWMCLRLGMVCVHVFAGVGVPECVVGLTGLQTEARYVLVVEKDATFQKLMETHFLRSFGPAILVTGKGYPDIATRQLVHRLWRDLYLPVLALTDADPYGLHIAAVYKFGALFLSRPPAPSVCLHAPSSTQAPDHPSRRTVCTATPAWDWLGRDGGPLFVLVQTTTYN